MMTASHWISLGFIGLAYIGLLFFLTTRAKRINVEGEGDDYSFATSGYNSKALIFLSFSATLFSTFTLMGVPDFFRNHGAATWVFIGFTDVSLGLVVLWFGLLYFRKIKTHGINTMGELLSLRFAGSSGRTVYLIGIVVFLLPYVAIQIQGVSELTTALLLPADSDSLLPYFVATGLLIAIYAYSKIGGLRAIMFSDVAQGIILLAVIYFIAVTILDSFGGIGGLLNDVALQDPALLFPPGPKDFMTSQYLLASFIAILWMPITQPQLTTRLAAASKLSDIPIIALGISFFAFVILLPTIVIGFAGAAMHPTSTSGEFLADTLVFSQAGWIGALSIVGLLAAAMSTADSQFFALRTETQQVVGRDPELRRKVSGYLFVVFFAAALVLAFVWKEEIVPLARVSFAGTALLGPMIVAALLHEQGRMGYAIPIVTIAALFVFLLSQLGFFPSNIGPMRLDLVLMLGTAAFALAIGRVERSKNA